MADPTDKGWWHRSAEAQPETPAARPRRRSHPPRSLAIVAAFAAVALAVAVLSGAFDGAHAGSPGSTGPHASNAWSGTLGVRVHSAYLASCQSAGDGPAYCACLFSQITAQALYNTPAAFAALSASAQRAQHDNDAAAIPAAVTQANDTCSTPAAGASSPNSAI